MFRPNFSFFAALLLASPASAKESPDRSDVIDLGARLERARAVIAAVMRPLDYGGVVRDEADLDPIMDQVECHRSGI